MPRFYLPAQASCQGRREIRFQIDPLPPAVVGCTERQWHRHHKLFPGPLAAVCLSDGVGAPVWCELPTSHCEYDTSSIVDGSLFVRHPYPYLDPGTLYARLWPRVREFAGPCTLARLRTLAAGRPAG